MKKVSINTNSISRDLLERMHKEISEKRGEKSESQHDLWNTRTACKKDSST